MKVLVEINLEQFEPLVVARFAANRGCVAGRTFMQYASTPCAKRAKAYREMCKWVIIQYGRASLDMISNGNI